MIEVVNGQVQPPQPEPGQLAMQVFWDDQKKSATVKCNPGVVPNWDFASVLLDMARRATEKAGRQAEEAALAMQAVEQQTLQQLHKKGFKKG